MKTQFQTIFLSLTSVLLLNQLAWSSSGGPDGFGYTWLDSAESNGPTYQWIDHTFEATTVLPDSTNAAATINLAVPWGGIYGEKVTQLRVSRNGFISTDLTDPGEDETNDCPLPATPSNGGGNRIYVLHDNIDLDPSNGTVKYEYFPQSPHSLHQCGVHVISWENVHHGTGVATRFSFQALLFDNFDILLQYGEGNPESGGGSTTGLQNAAATLALEIICNSAILKDNTAILIKPPISTVNTLADQLDSPAGAALSLREALRDAPNGSRIEFAVPTSPAPRIDLSTAGGGQNSRISLNNRNLALDASGLSQRPAIFGGDAVRHLLLNNNSHLTLCEMRLTHGFSASIFSNGASGSTWVQGGSSLLGYHCEFSQNVSNNDGGAIFTTGAGSRVHLTRCDLMANSARGQGGAIAARNGALLTGWENRVWLNRSTNNAGGAVALRSASGVLESWDFAENEASGNGGALLANVGAQCELLGCTFDSNTAINGGAVAAENSSGATNSPASLSFVNCTFFRNLALLNGGAIFENSLNANSDTATLGCTYSTFFRNAAGTGGGAVAVNDGTVTFQATCVAFNTVKGDFANFLASGTGASTSFGDNLESGTDMNFTSGGIDQQDTDPLLTDLGYYGGFVRTCIPLRDSPPYRQSVQWSGRASERCSRHCSLPRW